MTNKNPSIGILGAGISGLSTAYALSRKDIAATVYEKSAEAGGAIRSVEKNGWLVEEGPNTLMVKSSALWDLIEELGLGNEILGAGKSAQKRFVIKDKELVSLPMSAGDFLTTPLLSAGAKFRLLKEPFVAPSVHHDESIARFVKRRLGKEPLDYGVNPFVSGIYAGDPQSLSVKHTFSSLWDMEQQFGSLFKGLLKRNRKATKVKRALISFKKGNQQLAEAMAVALGKNLHTSTVVDTVKKEQGMWVVKGSRDGKLFEHKHHCLVSTLPAYAHADIFGHPLFEDLSDLPYVPMHVVALGFRKQQISHPLDGFGMLAPKVENLHFLGSLFSSTLFPGRAPKGHHLLTSFIGGARQPELANKSQQELQTLLLNELDQLIGIKGDPVFMHHKQWSKAIPQYEVGYDYFLSLMKEIEEEHHGLYLEGNFRGGVSVPDCISSGFETAQKATTFLKAVE